MQQSITLMQAELDRCVEQAFELGREAGHKEAHRGVSFEPRAGKVTGAKPVSNVQRHFEAAMAGRTGEGLDRIKRQQVIDAALGKLANFARGTV